MPSARRSKAKILYNGRDISMYVMDFSYTDNTDNTDDISIKLSNREKLWLGDWFPETGDTVNAEIQVFDWNGPNDNRTLALGDFEVDNVEFSDTMTINAVAVPISSSARSEKKYKSWDKIKLSSIASDIAKNAGLRLIYETEIDPYYDKSDQNNKSDLFFLEENCKAEGLCLKITNSQLIIFDESKYDTLPDTGTITLGKTDMYGCPSFKRNAKNIYSACEISIFDAKTDKTYTGYFKAPGTLNVGHILRLSESPNSESDTTGLDRKAKARLREQNKNEWTADFKLKGDLIYFAGANVAVQGFMKFDGKYNIVSCTHTIGGSGYGVTLSTRRCLEGY